MSVSASHSPSRRCRGHRFGYMFVGACAVGSSSVGSVPVLSAVQTVSIALRRTSRVMPLSCKDSAQPARSFLRLSIGYGSDHNSRHQPRLGSVGLSVKTRSILWVSVGVTVPGIDWRRLFRASQHVPIDIPSPTLMQNGLEANATFSKPDDAKGWERIKREGGELSGLRREGRVRGLWERPCAGLQHQEVHLPRLVGDGVTNDS